MSGTLSPKQSNSKETVGLEEVAFSERVALWIVAPKMSSGCVLANLNVVHTLTQIKNNRRQGHNVHLKVPQVQERDGMETKGHGSKK